MGGGEKWRIDLEDPVVRGSIVLKEGALLWPPEKPAAPPVAASPPKPAAEPIVTATPKVASKPASGPRTVGLLLVVGALCAALGAVAPREFIAHLTVFVLACFVGFQVIWNVTPALHTPLMSVTNAISGIIVLGGILQLTPDPTAAVTIVGALAV